ncbi:MAG: AMP-binding protein, partial [Magnetococcales bacterium]|nr:AMP-binding protein [Magnetococcales bacterium]
FAVTEEDQKRAVMYQEEQQRRLHQEDASSLENFLQTLEIQVFMEPLRQEHCPRVAQLTQRTNQFNLSTIRRTEAEITALISHADWRGWTIHVLDRFGDYGLVGVVLARKEENRLFTDTFLLSCRVLGRGVETAILHGLRRYCQEQGIEHLLAEYRATAKNSPILTFLTNSPLQQEGTTAGGLLFGAPCHALPEETGHIRFVYNGSPPVTVKKSVMTVSAIPTIPQKTEKILRWSPDINHTDSLLHKAHYLPLIHNHYTDLLNLPVEGPGNRERVTTPFLPPQGEEQHQMALIWQEVLGCGPVGRHDSFFELGGHSLKAVRMVSRIQKQFGVTIQLSELFAHPTIATLCAWIRNRSATTQQSIQPIAKQATYPLSNAQMRLWILQQMESRAIAYNTASLYEFRGLLHADVLEKALEAVALRHEALRTTFIQEQSQPRQRISPLVLAHLLRIDLSNEPDPDAQARILALDDARTPFDLAEGPLYRVTLIRLAQQRHLLLLNMHHIISDGWSMEILQNETMLIYEAILKNRPSPLSPLAIQYKDYAAYQNDRDTTAARAYWLEKLAEHPSLVLPTDFPRPPVQTFNGRVFIHDFTPETRASLLQLGVNHQATLFMVLTALIKILLLRQAGPQENRPITVGTPVAGRELPELEEQIGLYLNTIALHDILDPNETFASVMTKVKQTILAAFEHQFYPFDRLVEELNLEREMSRSPLFDVMVVMQDLLPDRPSPSGLTVSTYDVDAQISRFDLVFDFFEHDQQLRLAVTFNTDLFTPARIQRLTGQLTRLLQSVQATPQLPIRLLEILPDEERLLLLETFNHHRAPYPQQATIVDLFACQVAATPDAQAILEAGEIINYRNLDEWSNRIAEHLLTNFSLRHEEIVGVVVDRSAAFYAGILGIMKAGGAVLPIDFATPSERIDFMMNDSGCRILLEENGLNEFRTGTAPKISGSCLPNSLAYVIYTSGSTGQPKGVLVEQSGFVNMILAQIRTFGVTAQDRVLQFASPSFDAS